MVINKKEEELQDKNILRDILDFNVNLDSQLISKSNFIFGASTLILVFILNRLINGSLLVYEIKNLPLLILLFGSFISSLLSILVILPKVRVFSKKERIKADLFYYKNIIKFYSRKGYYNSLKNLPNDPKSIIKAYSNQIYSLATNILPFKFKLLKISGWILILSIFLSILAYLIIFSIF